MAVSRRGGPFLSCCLVGLNTPVMRYHYRSTASPLAVCPSGEQRALSACFQQKRLPFLWTNIQRYYSWESGEFFNKRLSIGVKVGIDSGSSDSWISPICSNCKRFPFSTDFVAAPTEDMTFMQVQPLCSGLRATGASRSVLWPGNPPRSHPSALWGHSG